MNFIRYFLIVVIGLILLLVLMYLQANTIRDWLNPDSFNITTTNDIDKNDLQVKWTVEGLADTLMIYNEGLEKDLNYKRIGENQFLVYYRNELIGMFNLFKTQVWTGHEYQVELGRDSVNDIIMTVQIIGPDAHR